MVIVALAACCVSVRLVYKDMKLRIVLTIALFTLVLAWPHTAWTQSNESQQKRREASEYDQNAMMGMYFAVMCELSSANGQTEQARGYAENALTYLKKPGDEFEFYAKGAAFVVLKKYDKALTNFDQAIQQNPEQIIGYIRRGRLYSLRGEFALALKDFDKAIELEASKISSKKEKDPSAADIQSDPRPWFDNLKPGDAYIDRGRVYLQQDDNDRAIAEFTKAIELNPEGATAFNHRGVAYTSKLDFDSAIADFDTAIQLDPLLNNAHSNRGIAFSNKGDEARARADFAIEEQLHPQKSSDPLNILNGRALKLVIPKYPPLARKAHASGTVFVTVVIDEEGKVIAAKAISGHPLLWAASVQAAKESLFSPTLVDDKPVQVTGAIQYNFIEH
jgi:TonB family protein